MESYLHFSIFFCGCKQSKLIHISNLIAKVIFYLIETIGKLFFMFSKTFTIFASLLIKNSNKVLTHKWGALKISG